MAFLKRKVFTIVFPEWVPYQSPVVLEDKNHYLPELLGSVVFPLRKQDVTLP